MGGVDGWVRAVIPIIIPNASFPFPPTDPACIESETPRTIRAALPPVYPV